MHSSPTHQIELLEARLSPARLVAGVLPTAFGVDLAAHEAEVMSHFGQLWTPVIDDTPVKSTFSVAGLADWAEGEPLSLSKTGAGTLTHAGATVYAGSVRIVAAGTLSMGASDSQPFHSAVVQTALLSQEGILAGSIRLGSGDQATVNTVMPVIGGTLVFGDSSFLAANTVGVTINSGGSLSMGGSISLNGTTLSAAGKLNTAVLSPRSGFIVANFNLVGAGSLNLGTPADGEALIVPAQPQASAPGTPLGPVVAGAAGNYVLNYAHQGSGSVDVAQLPNF
jgi:hypothetical protein